MPAATAGGMPVSGMSPSGFMRLVGTSGCWPEIGNHRESIGELFEMRLPANPSPATHYAGDHVAARRSESVMADNQQTERMRSGKGFIAALEQSGGSTPKALQLYGIDEGSYSSDAEMFDLMHEMRKRIIT